jgi:maleylpyruvate isomerase
MSLCPEESMIELDWLRDGNGLLSGQIAALTDEQIAQPCALPGWTRAHLLTHLARNADALVNLARWAETGTETPMYPGGSAQREADIEVDVARPPDVIRRDVIESADRLDRALSALPADAWTREVRNAQGSPIPASRIPWLRVREVWIHAVDLGTGVTFADFPADLTTALIDDVRGALSARPGCPDLTVVTGPAPALLGWLTGRTTGTTLAPVPLPVLPGWL